MAYFLSFHRLSDELEKITCLPLIVGVRYFPILRKNFPQTYSIII